MARPRKEAEIIYTHHINLRLTDVQYEIISENAHRAELSLSEYIRRQLMKGKVIAKYKLVADLPELKKLIFEFGMIGNNLNQIARRFYEEKPESPVIDFLVFHLNARRN